MTPDFAEFLLRTPQAERHGRVFRLNEVNTGIPLNIQYVGMVVSTIGRKAGIIVNAAEEKYATAHDLRRSFGTRWAKRVMPAVLRRLMRHSSIATTERYYIELDVDEMADDLWNNHGPEAGNTAPESVEIAGDFDGLV